MTDTSLAPGIHWPQKSREIHNHHFDSTVWNDFDFRAGDIVVATYAKSGTTWTQQIIGQLLFGGAPDVAVHAISPWLDLRVPPKADKLALLEAQQHRRFIKTHLPVDALVFSPLAKYLYVGRDGRDVVWSLYNHHLHANATWYHLINDTPGRVGPPIDPPTGPVEDYFRQWLEKDGHPFWPFWDNVRSWWEVRHLPNVLLVHFSDLKRDMAGEIERIAAFLNITVDDAVWDRILRHCSFDHMKLHAEQTAPLGGICWDGGGGTFINKGTNGRWRDMLGPEDSARYEQVARQQLGRECAHWLAMGGGAPRPRNRAG